MGMEFGHNLTPSKKEPPEEKPADPSRRNFLRILGTATAVAVATPVISKVENFIPDEYIDIKDEKKREEFIANEIKKLKEIITNKRYESIFSNSYLAYSLYYSKKFIDKISDPKNQKSSAEKILGPIAKLITSEFREKAILYLEKHTKAKEVLQNKKISTHQVLPLKKFKFGIEKKGKNGKIIKNHIDAVDLFTEEPSPIYASASGIVIVADKKWRKDDDLSSTSKKGGNTVIIFNYLTKEFYRYAHLEEVFINSGDLVSAGGNIGTVGHTGENASIHGHGEHLHFEINKYLSKEKVNRFLSDKEITKRLKTLKST